MNRPYQSESVSSVEEAFFSWKFAPSLIGPHKNRLKVEKVLDIACRDFYYRIINRPTVEKGPGYEKRGKKKTGVIKDRIPDVP